MKLEQNGVAVAPLLGVGGLMLDRGYTSHEHLAEVGLINMNGRLYDPKLHAFLMPDNFVKQPENTQNYNRYAYVLNNPLRYTDPSGEEFITLGVAMLIGAVVSAAVYTITCLNTGQSFTWQGLATATFIGAASAAVTFGIGSAAGSMFTQTATGFWQGAVQGAIVGSITGAGGAIVNGIFNGGNITLKEVLGGALIGGAIGAVAGGVKGGLKAQKNGRRFWDGARVNKITNSPIYAVPNLQQDGGYNCTQNSCAAIDQSTGGILTPNDVATNFPANYDPNAGTTDGPFWRSYAESKGIMHYGTSTNQGEAIFDLFQPNNNFPDGLSRIQTRIAFSTSDHSVVLRSVTKETITKLSGRVIENYYYNVMDPAIGATKTYSSTSIVNTFFLYFNR